MENKYNNLRCRLTFLIVNLSHQLNSNDSLEDQENSSLEELAETLDEYLDLRYAKVEGASTSMH
jgi:hypothetical protein